MTFARFNFKSAGFTGAIVGVSVLAVAAAVYLTPGAQSEGAVPERTKTVVHQIWPSPEAAAAATTGSKPPQPAPVKDTVVDTVVLPSESASSSTDTLPHCWDFTWQQDAQTAYLANLSDPGGLDGLAGPNNGDGLACNQLPVDPSRAASTPIDAIPTAVTTTPSKAELMGTASTYYGVSADALPGDTGAYDDVDAETGKAPSLLEFFDTWDHPYSNDGPKIKAAWSRGALPVLTWMPEAEGGTNVDQSAYQLGKIAQGDFDTYLYQWAAQVVQAGLPLAIRFAHEMNGSWYPWSAGITTFKSGGSPAYAVDNSPANYIAAWQHVWNVFQDVGANKYAIWAWTPVTTLCSTGSCTANYTSYQEDYPGAQYVDWVGLSSYASGPATKYTFAGTFQASFQALAAVSRKPVYVAETGAAQRVTSPGVANTKTFASATDLSALKVQWTTQVLQGFLDQGGATNADNFLNAGQRVIGFALFDNYVVNVHKVAVHHGNTITRVLTETDWRLDSSPEALAAFKAGVADPRYLAGAMPAVLPTALPDPDAVRWPVVTPGPSASATPTESVSASRGSAPTGAPSSSSPASSSSSSSASASATSSVATPSAAVSTPTSPGAS